MYALLTCGAAPAADIGRHANDSNTLNAISFSGEIVDGDLFRLKSYLAKLKGKQYTAIYLTSPGGKLLEGIEIGRFLRRAGIRSVTEARNVCLSACAFAFMGGYDFYSKGPWRTKSTSSHLGFHTFFQPLDRESYSRDEVGTMLRATQLTALELLEYFREVEADTRLLSAALGKEADDMFYISNAEALEAGINVWDESADEMVYSSALARFTR